MTLSHNSVKYSYATRALLNAMYKDDISEKAIQALVHPSLTALWVNWLFKGDFFRKGLITEVFNKPDLDAITLTGETILHRAVYLKRSDIIALLLRAQASTSIRNQHGEFPLHMAIHSVEKQIPSFKENHKDSVEQLLAYHADPNVVDSDGNMPLHIAALKGLDKVARLLIEKGAHVNAQNKQGITPLSYAIQGDWPIIKAPVISVLIENGANPMIHNKRGITAFYEAQEKQWLHLLSHSNVSQDILSGFPTCSAYGI